MTRVQEVHLAGQSCLHRQAVTSTDPVAVSCWACRRTRRFKALTSGKRVAA